MSTLRSSQLSTYLILARDDVVLATLYLYQETCKLSYEIKCDPQFFEKETPSKMIMFLIVLYAMGPIFSLI